MDVAPQLSERGRDTPLEPAEPARTARRSGRRRRTPVRDRGDHRVRGPGRVLRGRALRAASEPARAEHDAQRRRHGRARVVARVPPRPLVQPLPARRLGTRLVRRLPGRAVLLPAAGAAHRPARDRDAVQRRVQAGDGERLAAASHLGVRVRPFAALSVAVAAAVRARDAALPVRDPQRRAHQGRGRVDDLRRQPREHARGRVLLRARHRARPVLPRRAGPRPRPRAPANRRRLWLPAVLLAATVLCHIVIAVLRGGRGHRGVAHAQAAAHLEAGARDRRRRRAAHRGLVGAARRRHAVHAEHALREGPDLRDPPVRLPRRSAPSAAAAAAVDVVPDRRRGAGGGMVAPGLDVRAHRPGHVVRVVLPLLARAQRVEHAVPAAVLPLDRAARRRGRRRSSCASSSRSRGGRTTGSARAIASTSSRNAARRRIDRPVETGRAARRSTSEPATRSRSRRAEPGARSDAEPRSADRRRADPRRLRRRRTRVATPDRGRRHAAGRARRRHGADGVVGRRPRRASRPRGRAGTTRAIRTRTPPGHRVPEAT